MQCHTLQLLSEHYFLSHLMAVPRLQPMKYSTSCPICYHHNPATKFSVEKMRQLANFKQQTKGNMQHQHLLYQLVS